MGDMSTTYRKKRKWFVAILETLLCHKPRALQTGEISALTPLIPAEVPLDIVLECMRSEDLILRVVGGYVSTDDGAAYHGGAVARPIEPEPSYPSWKDEVLTGVVEKTVKRRRVSRKSPINNAALPTTSPTRETPQTPEERLIEMHENVEMKNRLMAYLECDEETFRKWDAEGRIKVCRGWNGRPHAGVFDFQRPKYLRHLCRRCIKRMREEKWKKK